VHLTTRDAGSYLAAADQLVVLDLENRYSLHVSCVQPAIEIQCSHHDLEDPPCRRYIEVYD